MIVKVKIAPFEKWCEPMRQAMALAPPHLLHRFGLPIGVEISIETSSMRTTQTVIPCGGKEWRVVELPAEITPFDAETGEVKKGGRGWICEHVLEMD